MKPAKLCGPPWTCTRAGRGPAGRAPGARKSQPSTAGPPRRVRRTAALDAGQGQSDSSTASFRAVSRRSALPSAAQRKTSPGCWGSAALKAISSPPAATLWLVIQRSPATIGRGGRPRRGRRGRGRRCRRRPAGRAGWRPSADQAGPGDTCGAGRGRRCGRRRGATRRGAPPAHRRRRPPSRPAPPDRPVRAPGRRWRRRRSPSHPATRRASRLARRPRSSGARPSRPRRRPRGRARE